MQLSSYISFILVFCIPFIFYINASVKPRKGFSILFIAVISIIGFLNQNYKIYLGLALLFVYLYFLEKKLSLVFGISSFFLLSYVLIVENTFFSNMPFLFEILNFALVSSIFSSMMIGHWYLVDPTISKDGMKNISLIATSTAIVILLFFLFYGNNFNFDILTIFSSRTIKNVIIGLLLATSLLSFGSYKSLAEKSYTGVMASTGLSYLALILSIGATGALILSI
jgi:hypothetical protein